MLLARTVRLGRKEVVSLDNIASRSTPGYHRPSEAFKAGAFRQQELNFEPLYARVTERSDGLPDDVESGLFKDSPSDADIVRNYLRTDGASLEALFKNHYSRAQHEAYHKPTSFFGKMLATMIARFGRRAPDKEPEPVIVLETAVDRTDRPQTGVAALHRDSENESKAVLVTQFSQQRDGANRGDGERIDLECEKAVFRTEPEAPIRAQHQHGVKKIASPSSYPVRPARSYEVGQHAAAGGGSTEMRRASPGSAKQMAATRNMQIESKPIIAQPSKLDASSPARSKQPVRSSRPSTSLKLKSPASRGRASQPSKRSSSDLSDGAEDSRLSCRSFGSEAATVTRRSSGRNPGGMDATRLVAVPEDNAVTV